MRISASSSSINYMCTEIGECGEFICPYRVLASLDFIGFLYFLQKAKKTSKIAAGRQHCERNKNQNSNI